MVDLGAMGFLGYSIPLNRFLIIDGTRIQIQTHCSVLKFLSLVNWRVIGQIMNKMARFVKELGYACDGLIHENLR